jgi:hypothetical protein
MVILSSLGIVGLYWCFTKGMSEFNKRRHTEKLIDIVKNPPVYWRDFIMSISIILLSMVILKGVTGMLIGLLSSVMISLLIQISSKISDMRKVAE